jgi:hypothetical protein
MGNTVKISFSAVTHVGTSCTVNRDRIFANGRFLRPSAADYAQITRFSRHEVPFYIVGEYGGR